VNSQLLDRYVAATAHKHDLENDLRKVQDELNLMEPILLEEFLADGTQSVKNSAGATTYLFRQLWAGVEEGSDYDRACAALRAAGLDDLIQVRFNSQSLSAYCRELEKDDQGQPVLPASFAGSIKCTERVSVRVRGA